MLGDGGSVDSSTAPSCTRHISAGPRREVSTEPGRRAAIRGTSPASSTVRSTSGTATATVPTRRSSLPRMRTHATVAPTWSRVAGT